MFGESEMSLGEARETRQRVAPPPILNLGADSRGDSPSPLGARGVSVPRSFYYEMVVRAAPHENLPVENTLINVL